MASSAIQTDGFVDPYEAYNPESIYNANAYYGDSGVPGWWMKLMGQDMSKVREYDKTLQNQAYERASINSARAWDEYMDSTQVQRRVKDIEAAGLNPWLAIQNGVNSSGSSSADTGGSAQHQTSSSQSSSVLGMLFMALAKIFTTKA